MAVTHQAFATGRRKNAVARVRVFPGTGDIRVNGRSSQDYFKRPILEMMIRQPFEVTETIDRFDIRATCSGGGVSGQASALRHGIARALCQIDALKYRSPLKKAGFLTRDPRMVERKKYGQRGARARFQWCKR